MTTDCFIDFDAVAGARASDRAFGEWPKDPVVSYLAPGKSQRHRNLGPVESPPLSGGYRVCVRNRIYKLVPQGRAECSPGRQSWVGDQLSDSPEGTAECLLFQSSLPDWVADVVPTQTLKA